ncbi:PAS domain S-box protein, partial [Granulosicoccus sp.]
MRAQLKFQEQDRLETLRGFGVLDTLEEQSFDDITALTAEICDIPVCLVSFVDENRQWFKSKIGLDICETPFDQSICAHALVQDDYLEIADTEQDVRTVDNPLCMGKKPFRFYAGAILRTNAGVLLGTLCVLDYHPRSLTRLQQKVLKIHANHVVKLLELRVTLETEKTLRLQAQEQQVALAQSEDRLDAILTAAPCGILSVDEDGVIHSANNAISKISGYAQSELVGQNIELLAYDMIQDSAIISSRKDGSQVPVEIGLNRTKLQDGSNQIVATVVDITARVKAEEERDHLISRVTRTRKVPKTRWYSANGRTSRHFDDVLVGATKTLPRQITDWLAPWDLENLIPYTEDYLAGFSSEVYQVDLDEGFNIAQESMDKIIRGDVRRAIGGDKQRITSLKTHHS